MGTVSVRDAWCAKRINRNRRAIVSSLPISKSYCNEAIYDDNNNNNDIMVIMIVITMRIIIVTNSIYDNKKHPESANLQGWVFSQTQHPMIKTFYNRAFKQNSVKKFPQMLSKAAVD